MLDKEKLISEIRLLIEKEASEHFQTESPPTSLTLALLTLDLVDQPQTAHLLDLIATKVTVFSLWHTSLIEPLAVFDYKSDVVNVTFFIQRYIVSSNWHKLSSLFGHRNKTQKMASTIISDDHCPLVSVNTDPQRLYPLLAIAYCANAFDFRSLIARISAHPQFEALFSKNVIPNILGDTKSAVNEQVKLPANRPSSQSQLIPLRRLRVAVCVSGQLRGFRKCFSTLKALGLDSVDYEVFVSTWKRVGGRFPSLDQAPRIFPPDFVAPFREVLLGLGEESFVRRYPSLLRLIDSDSEISKTELESIYSTTNIDLEDDQDESFRHVQSIVKMHYKLQRCYSLVEQSGRDFDLVVRLRPDLQLKGENLCDWNFLYTQSLNNNVVFADFATFISPRVINWTIGNVLPLMIGDLFAVGALQPMSHYMNSFNENLNLINKKIVGLPHGFMPHTTLSRILMYHGVIVEDFPFAKIDGSDLIEHDILSADEIGDALTSDINGRALDSIDQLLLKYL